MGVCLPAQSVRVHTTYSGDRKLKSNRVIMKLAILGATGQTGLEAVKQALAANHTVTALVRNPAKMTLNHDNLQVVEANIFSADSLKQHLGGQDAVLSCLGFPPQKPKVTGYTEATQAMVSAMREVGVKRLVLCHSWYTEEASRSQAMFLIRWFLLPMIGPVLNNMRETEIWLENEASDLDWTVVRPAGLTNNSVTDKDFTVKEDYHVAGAVGRIARADVARFMLSNLSLDENIKKGVAIAV